MVGIFDSGSGGLSVFREIYKLLPTEKYVYFADNAWCPYGEKAREVITDRCRFITDFLLDNGAEAIVIACNTATAAAIETLRNEYPVPFIGTEPAVKPAVKLTSSGVVGVLATAGTLGAEKYHATKERFADNVKIVEHIGKGFVELVENGIVNGPLAEETVRLSLSPLLEEGADVIVLGCTHYPFLEGVITKCCHDLAPDRNVRIINPAPAIARRLCEVMGAKPSSVCSDIRNAEIELHASGNPDGLFRFFHDLQLQTTK